MAHTKDLWRVVSLAMALGTAGYSGFMLSSMIAPQHSGDVAHAQTAATTGAGKTFGLGREATAEEVAAWDIDIRPDGQGLPVGQGSVLEGEEIYLVQCAVCHGDFGEGAGRWPVLAGGADTLAGEDPLKTVGSYWPYLSTVYDYVHRAMPFGNAQSLSDDQVYAVTAYILYLNDVVDDEEFVLSNETFGDIKMPNEDGFFMDDRDSSPIMAKKEACMSNCKDKVEITARARVIDVTPEDGENPSGEAVESAGVEAGGGGASAEPVEAAAVEPAAPAAAPIDEALAEAGAKAFKKNCKSCHQVGEGARQLTGPVLTHSFGSTAGSVEGFRYSKALKGLKDEGFVWNSENLDAFLTKPRDVAKGTKMSFRGLKKAEDRAAIIEYLRQVAQ